MTLAAVGEHQAAVSYAGYGQIASRCLDDIPGQILGAGRTGPRGNEGQARQQDKAETFPVRFISSLPFAALSVLPAGLGFATTMFRPCPASLR